MEMFYHLRKTVIWTNLVSTASRFSSALERALVLAIIDGLVGGDSKRRLLSHSDATPRYAPPEDVTCVEAGGRSYEQH